MKTITLNTEEFDKSVKELVKNSPPNPDLLIGILTGGGYLVSSMEKQGYHVRTKKILVKLQRSTTKRKESWLISSLLKILPYSVLNFLRNIESSGIEKSIGQFDLNQLDDQNLNIEIDWDLLKKAKNILIVDDAIDTGKTIYLLKNAIQKKCGDNSKIYISVISWTIRSSIVKPDFHIFKDTLVRFPWSRDYKGKDFEPQDFSS